MINFKQGECAYSSGFSGVNMRIHPVGNLLERPIRPLPKSFPLFLGPVAENAAGIMETADPATTIMQCRLA